MIARSSNYQAYQQASQTVSKTRQIVMLYDGTIRFLQQAKQAEEENNIPERFSLLTKASKIIVSLQSSLDFDASHDIATTLHDFYSSVSQRISELHRSRDLEKYDTLIADIKAMRDQWEKLDSEAASQATSTNAQPSAETTGDSSQDSVEAYNHELLNSITVSA
jgi:flagellar protein FliS